MSDTPQRLEELLKNADRLPTLPAVALKILEVARKEDASVSEIEAVISADPPLAAKVLRIVNSPFYSLPRKVTSVRQAVSLLGINSVKNLALGFSLVKGNSLKRSGGFDYPAFWKKSIISAVASRALATWVPGGSAEDCFFLGLLEDIGVLALNQMMPKRYAEVLQLQAEQKLPLFQAEREVVGFDHCEAGDYLTRSWGLPPGFHLPIRYHHSPEKLENPALRPLARILSTAGAMASFFYHERPLEALQLIRESAAAQGIGDRVEQLMIRVFSEAVEIARIFELDMAHQPSYVAILEQANVELDKNSLNLQKSLLEHVKENEQLKGQVTRDSLTGLHNSRFFDELMEREIHRALRYHRPLGLIVGDIDKFRDFNDTYGHQMGDEALVGIAKLFGEKVRKSDLVARHGGEEYAILCVETDIEDAVAMADRLREEVANLRFFHGGREAQVTISFGLTAIDPEQAVEIGKEEMLRLADEALYEAKRTGRNRCCVRLFNPQRTAQPPKHPSGPAQYRM